MAFDGRVAAIPRGASSCGVRARAQVTTLFGTYEPRARSRHTMLPILTVLFLISYGLMTLLIVEQGSTIQSQRTMIQQLLGDSQELAGMRVRAHNEALSRQAQNKNQEPTSSADAPSTQAPSKQAAPAGKARTDHGGKV